MNGKKPLSNWISRYRDYVNVGLLSIPGTHESGTYRCNYGNPCYTFQFQSWSTSNQLDAGIRFLDLRVRFGKEWRIAHDKL